MEFPYKMVFLDVEKALLDYGSKQMPRDEIQKSLDKFKSFHDRELTDDDYFSILVDVTFYSGFRAATVTKRRPVIHGYFANYDEVADFEETDIERMLADQEMIRNRRKIQACIHNAGMLREIVNSNGSFRNYVDGFLPKESFENLLLLKEELQAKFAYLGGITVYHFLTELGLPVIKPDRVICRIFRRLGLIENDRQLMKTVIHGRKFAEATGLPLRYIDIVLVAYGQVASHEFGIDRGICLDQPRCQLCKLSDYCNKID